MFTVGLLVGLKHSNIVFDQVEIVYLNMPDTLRMRAFHTECIYVQDIWKEGIEDPIVANFITRILP